MLLLFVFSINSSAEEKPSGDSGKSPLPYLACSALLPGSGQLFAGAKLKGSALFALEAILLASAYNDGIYMKNRLEPEINRLKERLIQPYATSIDSIRSADSLLSYMSSSKYHGVITTRTIVFASGVYFTNLIDCWLTIRPQNKPNERSASSAFARSMIVPGWGQLYNGEPVKAAMFITAISGLLSNIMGWHRLGNWHRTESSKLDNEVLSLSKQIAALPDSAETRPTLENSRGFLLSMADKELRLSTKYHSKRNENIWYALAVYLFASFDAVVDAHLAGFDRRINFSVIPNSGEKLDININLPIKP